MTRQVSLGPPPSLSDTPLPLGAPLRRVRTLILGDYAQADLGNEAALQELLLHLPPDSEPVVASPEEERLKALDPRIVVVPRDTPVTELRPDRVVLAGPMLPVGGLGQALSTLAAARSVGAEVGVHNLGLAFGTPRPSAAAAALAGLLVTVREHRSAEQLLLWGLSTPPRILAFPERAVPPDPTIANRLPSGLPAPLALCVRGNPEFRTAWMADAVRLRALLAPYAGRPVLPLPLSRPGATDRQRSDEAAAIRLFLRDILPGTRLVLPDLLTPDGWAELTPARVKGLVARCAAVAAQRDLLIAYAVATGVPAIALGFGWDRRAPVAAAALANHLPADSVLHWSPKP